MSEPLRFKPVNPAHEMVYSADGGWVSWEDYARLKAEVERLTNAGDTIIHILCKYVPRTGAKYALMDWRAAKEGKPHA